MSVRLLTEHRLEFLCLKGGCTGSSESTHVKIPHCWKSHVAAQLKARLQNLDLFYVKLVKPPSKLNSQKCTDSHYNSSLALMALRAHFMYF